MGLRHRVPVDAGTNALVTLASFAGGTEGRGPYDCSGLAVDAYGNFYGTTWRGGTSSVGTLFKASYAGFVTARPSATFGSPRVTGRITHRRVIPERCHSDLSHDLSLHCRSMTYNGGSVPDYHRAEPPEAATLVHVSSADRR